MSVRDILNVKDSPPLSRSWAERDWDLLNAFIAFEYMDPFRIAA